MLPEKISDYKIFLYFEYLPLYCIMLSLKCYIFYFPEYGRDAWRCHVEVMGPNSTRKKMNEYLIVLNFNYKNVIFHDFLDFVNILL